MRHILFAILTSLTILSCSSERKASAKPSVKWLTIDEVQEKMKSEPKKVLIDIYTDWCGPCKRMSKYTFTDPKVVDQINKNFYAVKFNAESSAKVSFLNKTYTNRGRTHQFAIDIGSTSRGLAYPTIAYFDESFKKIQSMPGYYHAQEYLVVLKYFGRNHYKTSTYDDFYKSN